jgi:hypothetical protein
LSTCHKGGPPGWLVPACLKPTEAPARCSRQLQDQRSKHPSIEGGATIWRHHRSAIATVCLASFLDGQRKEAALKTRDETDVLPALTADLRLSRLHSLVRYKVLEAGKFAWPKVQDGTMRLSRAQYEALFEGLDWRRVMAQRVTAPTAAG